MLSALIRGQRRRRYEPSSTNKADIAEVIEGLPLDLLISLARLHEAPPGIAEEALRLLPFGSRALLQAMDLAHEDVAVDGGRGTWKLSPLAYEVMAAAAASARTAPHRQDLARRS
jgi:hypothetical protein